MHVQRTLRALRKAGLVAVQDRVVVILDLAALQGFAGFEAAYLHLDERRPEEVA